ncbi:MAG: BatD family protein [Bacteroidales bacterium]|nr:BatD family protein [Bacteroidales bacterium]HOI33009.1 BatD family protein [Bacteroidales bacterium]
MLEMKYIRSLLFFLLIPLAGFSQEVMLKVSTKSQVGLNEQFQVVFELNAEGERFKGPNFADWRVLSGPMSSTSSSIQIINGQMTRNFTQSYTYIVTATKEGTFEIGSAEIIVDGKTIKSSPVTVKVVKGSSSASTESGNQSQGQGITDKDLFLRAIIDKKEVVTGEQVIVTYRIYTRVPVSSVSVTKLSAFPGFWTKDLLSDNEALQQSTEVINGVEYTVANIRKMALFPQKNGKLNIEPMELECVAQVRTQTSRQRSRDPFESFFNDPFFNRGIANVQKNLVSEPLSIEVKSLPSQGKPLNFSGAVGQFEISSGIDKTTLQTNDGLTLSYTISGQGNIELAELPQIQFPPDFEVYDPKITNNLKTSANGISGSKKFEYLLIPRTSGEFKLNELQFSYYDPKKQTYNTLKTPAYNITVEKSGDVTTQGVFVPGQSDVKYIGSDIRHIKTNKLALKPIGKFFFGSPAYLAAIALMLIIFAVSLIYTLKRKKLNKNHKLIRNKKATKIARKRLKTANLHLKNKNQNEFYTEISQALWGYIRDKFDIEPSKLALDYIAKVLKEKDTPDTLIDELVETLNKCEFARFAPGESGKKMEELYSNGIEIITKIEKTVK